MSGGEKRSVGRPDEKGSIRDVATREGGSYAAALQASGTRKAAYPTIIVHLKYIR
jgi:hypothetical protein